MDFGLLALIKELATKPNLTFSSMESSLGESRRQIEYKIEKLNLLLKKKKLAQLVEEDDVIILDPNSKKELLKLLAENENKNKYVYSPRERLTYIYLLLFLNIDYISLNDFLVNLRVSRSTVISDLKILTGLLGDKKLDISYSRKEGYKLVGEELLIRNYAISLILKVLENPENTFVLDSLIDEYDLYSYDYSRLIISELGEKNSIKLYGARLTEFIYIFMFLGNRINNTNFELNDFHIPLNIEKLDEYKFTEEIISYFKKFMTMDKRDISYFTAWILGISVGNVEDETPDTIEICEIVGRIMQRFQFITGIHYDNAEEIFRQLYSHFRPAFYRLLFNIPVFNPLVDRVKEEYGELYYLVEETFKEFSEAFNINIPDSEISYFTVHFGAIFTRGKDLSKFRRKKAGVVMTGGIGLHRVLMNDIGNLFPEVNFYTIPYNEDRLEIEEGTDFIVTSIYKGALINSPIPIIKIKSILNMKERMEFVRDVYSILGKGIFKRPSIAEIMTTIGKYAEIKDENGLKEELTSLLVSDKYELEGKDTSNEDKNYSLKDMVDISTTALRVEGKNYKEVIENCGSYLIRAGKVEKKYVDSIIKEMEVNNFSFTIMPHVALPHTKPEKGAKDFSLGIFTLANEVNFPYTENNPVKYVFFLSCLDNKKHLPTMMALLKLLQKDSFFKLLDGAKDPKELIDGIIRLSNKE